MIIQDKGIIRDRVNVDENKVNKVPKIYAKNNYDEYTNVIPVQNRYNAFAVENVNTGEKESTEPTSKPKTKYRSTTIIGDSIIRDIKQHRIRKDLPGNKIFIKSFSGATTEWWYTGNKYRKSQNLKK